MEQTIKFIVESLVDNPNDVKIVSTVDDDFVNIQIFVNEADMGKVIGKSGKIATAIRTLARALARHENKRVNVKIGE